MNQRSRQRVQNATTTTTPAIEDWTEEESARGVTSTTTEDPVWSRPASQMTEKADIATTGEYSTGTTKKKHPKFNNGNGDQGSHETKPEHIARLKNSLTDHAQYTGSKTSVESSDQGTHSVTAGD